MLRNGGHVEARLDENMQLVRMTKKERAVFTTPRRMILQTIDWGIVGNELQLHRMKPMMKKE
jgi:hypothetical protein